jgi:hypothetical protein
VSENALPDRPMPDGMITMIKTATRALILACAAPGSTGPERVEQLTGYSRGAITRWQGDQYPAVIPLETVCLLESLLGKPIFSHMLAQLSGHRVEPAGEGEACDGSDLMGAVMRSTGSHARFTAQAAEALEDQKVTPREAKDLLAALLAHQDQMGMLAARLANLAGA